MKGTGSRQFLIFGGWDRGAEESSDLLSRILLEFSDTLLQINC